MKRQLLGLAAFLTAAMVGSTVARAQTTSGANSHSPTLVERLGQFRDDLFSDDDGRPAGKPAKKTQATATPSADSKARGGSAPASSPTLAEKPKSGSRSTSRPAAANNSAARNEDKRDGGTADEPHSAQRSSRRTQQPDFQPETQPKKSSERSDRSPTLAPAPVRAPSSLQEKLSAVRDQPADDDAASPSDESEAVEPRTLSPEQLDPADSSTAEEAPAKLPEPPAKRAPAAHEQATRDPVNRESAKREAADGVLFSGQSPMLSIEASGPRKVLIGKEATFTVKVRNAGAVAANNVIVAIDIPPFAEVVGSQPTSGSIRTPNSSDRTEPCEWKLSRLEPHARETLTLRIVARKSNPIDLAMHWTCSPETSQAVVEVQEPKLLMALSGPSEVLYGQSKVYKLTLSNPGNGEAENVMVSLLPLGRGTDAPVNHRLGTLRAGESKAIEVELTARQAGDLTIKAQAFAEGGLRSEASTQVLVRRANLVVEAAGPKVKYAGTATNYRIRVANNGNAAAEGVHVSALLPPEAKYVASNNGGKLDADGAKVVWNVGAMQPGGQRVFEMQCTLQAQGDNHLQVAAAGEADLAGSAGAVTRVEALADLKLDVRDPQGPIPVGEDAVYEVVIRNRGTKSAEGIDLLAFFSEGLEATSVQGGPHEISPGQVVFKRLPSLAAGSEAVYRIHTQADRGGNHVFRAEVVCQSLHTKLAAEETTHFYGDDSAGERSTLADEPADDAGEPATAGRGGASPR